MYQIRNPLNANEGRIHIQGNGETSRLVKNSGAETREVVQTQRQLGKRTVSVEQGLSNHKY